MTFFAQLISIVGPFSTIFNCLAFGPTFFRATRICSWEISSKVIKILVNTCRICDELCYVYFFFVKLNVLKYENVKVEILPVYTIQRTISYSTYPLHFWVFPVMFEWIFRFQETNSIDLGPLVTFKFIITRTCTFSNVRVIKSLYDSGGIIMYTLQHTSWKWNVKSVYCFDYIRFSEFTNFFYSNLN